MNEVKNLTASIRQRLLNQAHQTNRPYNEILQYFAIERFLYRISRSRYFDRFVLKGALMFLAWGKSPLRPTRDIDFLGFTSNDISVIEHIFKELCDQEVEPDGLVFDAQSVQGERIKEDADYEGVRIHLTGFLGRARIPLQIDIGFADVVFPAPILLDYPSMLKMAAPHLRGYPPESVVAEKLQALVFLGSINSRMKDFYDLWVLAAQFEFDGDKLKEAITQTFKHRNTAIPDDIPIGLTDAFAAEKQSQWQAFLKRTRIETGAESFLDIIQSLKPFLLPMLQSGGQGKLITSIWEPGRGWNERR